MSATSDTGSVPSVLNDELREVFRRMADVMIPRVGEFPSASEAQVHGAVIDRLLALRPDLQGPFLAALSDYVGADPETCTRELSVNNPEGLSVIGMLAAIGYYQDGGVRAAIGYPGQSHRTYDAESTPDYLENGQLQAVVDRGPIFRPTPGR